MPRKILAIALVSLTVLMFDFSRAWADQRDDEIADLKAQVNGLIRRIEVLEQERAEAKQETKKPQEADVQKSEPSVVMEKLPSRLKIKGRVVVGFFDSGKAGSYPSGSFEVPDIKIQFGFEPDDINKIVLRMNLNSGTFSSLDYAYIDTNLSELLHFAMPLNSRIGRARLEFGEETVSNNAVEGALPSNSAANVDGKDEGFQLYGKWGKAKSFGYAISVTNGNSGTGSDNGVAKSFTGKLFTSMFDPLAMSVSYHNSGSLKSSNAEMSIAGLTSRPANAARWSRDIWEFDLRYDFKKGKILNPPAFSDSKAIIRLAYGVFNDDVSTTAALGDRRERSGQYGFTEGLYHLTDKFYLAGRVSVVDLAGDVTASLNNITCNNYERYSLGMGYRLTGNVILKASYDWNRESGPGVDEVDNDLLSAVVTSQF